MPPPQPSSPPTEPPRGSWISFLLAAMVGFGLFVGFVFLMAPLGGIGLAAAGIVGLLAVVAGGHYLLWGRWLGDVIRREVAEEEQRNDQR